MIMLLPLLPTVSFRAIQRRLVVVVCIIIFVLLRLSTVFFQVIQQTPEEAVHLIILAVHLLSSIALFQAIQPSWAAVFTISAILPQSLQIPLFGIILRVAAAMVCSTLVQHLYLLTVTYKMVLSVVQAI